MDYLIKNRNQATVEPDGMFFPVTIEGSLVEIAATLVARHASLSASIPNGYSIHIVEQAPCSVSDWLEILS